MSSRALVIGGTGTVGSRLARALAARGVAARAASRAGRADGAAEGARFDWDDPATHAPAFDGVDRAYLIFPPGRHDVPAMLAPVLEVARARGAKLVLQTAMGVEASEDIPLRRAERMVEASGLAHAFVRPSWFMENFLTYWRDGIERGLIELPAGEGRTGFVAAADIAEAAAAALTEDRWDGGAYALTGPESLIYGEAAAVLSAAWGRPVAYRASTPEAFVAGLVAKGMPADYAGALAGLLGVVAQGWAAALAPDVERLTGRAPTSLRAWAEGERAALAA